MCVVIVVEGCLCVVGVWLFVCVVRCVFDLRLVFVCCWFVVRSSLCVVCCFALFVVWCVVVVPCGTLCNTS